VDGKTRQVPRDQWIWSPQPTRPAIITRQMWENAQDIGAEHATARDGTEPSAHPLTRRTYILRSRVRCRICRRRMCGVVRTSSRYYTGEPDVTYVYYKCAHNTGNQRHFAAAPDHPKTVTVRAFGFGTSPHTPRTHHDHGRPG